MHSISDNIQIIREQIALAAGKSGRSADDITLVAAAKTQSTLLVKQAVAAGITVVGENRTAEMLTKREEGAYEGASLHYIGHLQSNKVNKLVGVCDIIETVSSEKLVKMIGSRAMQLGITQDALIEVNIGSEPQKSGVLPGDINRILDTVSQTAGINVLGLMAIPPFCNEIERICYYFERMYQLFVDIRAKKRDNVLMRILSMGMSDSYKEAICAGANMVRIGTAIFGNRY